ncbi:MAG TPA: hypothetical protein VLC52_14500, partial [Anaerolineae bacterium]|nr:hypothetical protein [Anaerolineae bacterium]
TGHALWLYEPGDFLGLSQVAAESTAQPEAWAPFARQHPAWLLLPLAAVALALALRCARGGRENRSQAA